MADDQIFEKWRPNSDWFTLAGISSKDREEKKRLIQRVLSSTDLFDIVKAKIDKEWREMESHEENEREDFADAAWAEKQAFRNGKRAAYREMRKFLPDPDKSKY